MSSLTAVTTNWFVLDIRLANSQFLGGALLIASVTAITQLENDRGQPLRTQPETQAEETVADRESPPSMV